MPGSARLSGCEGDIGPQFSVHMLKGGVNHRQMAVAKLRLLDRWPKGLHLFGFRIEPYDLHLGHVAEINPPFPIDIDLETTLSDLPETVLWHPILDHLAGFGIELPNKLGIEIRIPNVSLCIKHL